MILTYLALYGLVLLYANLYTVWLFLASEFGQLAHYLPFFAAALLLSMIVLTRSKQTSAEKPNNRWMILGGLLVAIALFIPDPQFPAKRAHVAEYVLLAFLVFLVQRPSLTGRTLISSVAITTLLYGLHDEMMQGLLPSRTFGLQDALVDGIAGLGGSCLIYARLGDTQKSITTPFSQYVILALLLMLPVYWLASQLIPSLVFR